MGNEQSVPKFTSANTDPRAPPPPPPPGPAQPQAPPLPSDSFNLFDPLFNFPEGQELIQLVNPQVEEFQKQQPSRLRESGLYKEAIRLYAEKFGETAREFKILESGKMVVGATAYPLDRTAIKPYVNPRWSEFESLWEKTRKAERDMIGISPGWSEFMKKTRIEKVDKMYEIVRKMKDKLLSQAKDLQQPGKMRNPGDPLTIEERLAVINAMGGRKSKHRKRKHKKRKTRR
jgi:hypothetical protein